jgi:hypothetical protein
MTENPRIIGTEGMGHNDVACYVQCKVTVRCELFDGRGSLGFVGTDQRLDLFQARNVGLAGESGIDGPSHLLDYVAVHGTFTKALWEGHRSELMTCMG